MVKRKQRSKQQIMEEQSIVILKKALPKEWVLHEYGKDYGIDFVLEFFNSTCSSQYYETLGEQFFIQLKSVKSIKENKIKIYRRKNIEKFALEDGNDYIEIDVFKFKIDVSLLLTIQSMGSITPVMLFIVDLSTEEIYYICLNDYIDKILCHTDLELHTKYSKTLNIPLENKFSNEEHGLKPLEKNYAKRSKMYSAFIKFTYQYGEIKREAANLNMIKHFIFIIKNLDIWKIESYNTYYNDLLFIEKLLQLTDHKESINLILEKHDFSYFFNNQYYDYESRFNLKYECSYEKFIIDYIIEPLWHKLSNFLFILEETQREFHLPLYHMMR